MALQDFWLFVDFALEKQQLLEMDRETTHRRYTVSRAVHIKVYHWWRFYAFTKHFPAVFDLFHDLLSLLS
ncbi:hypothetical protein [Pseudomonas sp. PSB11]|uniref:hypothetical protein n=1 Tax=Pseudomonas sp. PSB11 TaxID=2021969 RepID=UPI0016601915|nr:hypothetical protein [Pseudomonas sp. PSB11]MBD0677198.1 hypothetical protein [Pseudomonas sp. PSB11]